MIKTLVELYDKEPVENVLAACVFEPALVVYVCDITDNSLRKETAVYRLLKSKGIKTKPRFYYIDTTDFAMIYRTLSAIARDYPSCVFDFTGGKDLVLLAAGIFCKEHNVDGFYIDIATGRFCKVFGCYEMAKSFFMPKFCSADIFALAGAALQGYGHFPRSLMDEEFENDIFIVWDIMIKNPAAWGGLVSFLQAALRQVYEDELSVNSKQVVRVNDHTVVKCNLPVLRRLQEANIINQLSSDSKHVSFRIKNGLLKKCLTNHGIWLELYAYLCCKRSCFFDDARTSVLVDWEDAPKGHDTTRNEIDVLLVKGVTPVFISCKTGQPTALAMSEIKIISEKFGGIFTKTVIMTASNLKQENKALLQRATDLGIYVLDKSDLDSGNLAKLLLDIAVK